MLEAAQCEPRFTISLKRSTQNLQLSTRTPADYSIYRINSEQTAPSGLTGSAAIDPIADGPLSARNRYVRAAKKCPLSVSAFGVADGALSAASECCKRNGLLG
jgi:hypothetical protein